MIEEGRGGVDDDLEPAARLDQALQLLIAAKGGGQGREQLVGRELGLRLVVVDVVIDDHPPLGGLARLPRPQDDPDRLILQTRDGYSRRGRGLRFRSP